MKLDVVKICAGLIIVFALLMCSSVATETTWRHAGFELWGYDINFTSHNATNVKNIDAENITSEKIGGVIYADQYATIQDAINASTTGQEIKIKAGTYTSSGLTAQSDVIISGMGEDVTIIQAFGAISSMLYFDNVSNFKMKDLTLDGIGLATNVVQTKALGSSSSYNENICFENIVFNGSSSQLLNIYGNGKNYKFDHVTIKGSGLDGLHLQYNISDVTILNSLISDNYRDGIALGDYSGGAAIGIPVSNVKIIGNTIEENAIGINVEDGSYSDGVQNLSIQIIGNTIQKNTKSVAYGGCSGSPGININVNSSGVIIDANTITENFLGITIGTSGNTPNNIISNNNIYKNNAVPADTISRSGIYLGHANGTVIIGNNLHNHTRYGVTTAGINLRDIHVTDNQFYNNQQRGIYAYRMDGYSTIDSNFFKNNGLESNNVYDDLVLNDDGVAPYVTKTSISHNSFFATASNKSRYAISILGTGTSNIICNNIFEGHVTGYINVPSDNIVYNNYPTSPFNFGNNATAPTPFGAGDEYYNSTDNKKYCYDGSAWNSLY